MNKLDKGMIRVPSGTEQNMRFHYVNQDNVQFKSYEGFISGFFNLTFSDHGQPR